MVLGDQDILSTTSVFVEVTPTKTRHTQVIKYLSEHSASREELLQKCQISSSELDTMLSQDCWNLLEHEGRYSFVRVDSLFALIDGVLIYLNADIQRSENLDEEDILRFAKGLVPD